MLGVVSLIINKVLMTEVQHSRTKDDKTFEAADPISLDMKCNYLGKAFRYVFFIIEDTYMSHRWSNNYPYGYEDNANEYITFDELEVFVKMENK